jgi:hypothetical protein
MAGGRAGYDFDIIQNASPSSGSALPPPIWVESNQTGLKVVNTNYQNTSGKDMLVFVSYTQTGTTTVQALSDGSTPPTTVVSSVSAPNANGMYLEFWVKAGDFYRVPSAGIATVSNWIELTLTKGSITDSGDIVGSKALSTVYQNLTGSALWVAVQFGTAGTAQFLTDASPTPATQVWSSKTSGGLNMTAMVPVLAGHYYQVTATTATLLHWHEYTLNGFVVTRSASIGPGLLIRLVNNNQVAYYNNQAGAIYGICGLHTTGTTSSILVKMRPTLAGTGSMAGPFFTTIDPVPAFMSSTTTDVRTVNYTVNPGEFYVVYIDNGAVAAYDNWYEWTIV